MMRDHFMEQTGKNEDSHKQNYSTQTGGSNVRMLYFVLYGTFVHIAFITHVGVFLIQEVRVLLLSNLAITNYESLHLSCEVPHDFHTPAVVPPK